MVDCRNNHGGDHFRGGYAPRRYRTGGEKRNRRKLAVVEHAFRRNAHRVFLLPVVAQGRDNDEKHYVLISRIYTVALMIVSVFVTANMTGVSDAWQFIIECSAGIGLVLILRWYWWRINAWSEISAMIAPILLYPFIKGQVLFPDNLFYLVGFSTLVWVITTYLTAPTDEKTLFAFCRKIHPGGILWKHISDKLPDVESDKDHWHLFIDWAAGCVLVFFTLFGAGKIIFGEVGTGLLFLAIALSGALVIYLHLSKIGWKKLRNRQFHDLCNAA